MTDVFGELLRDFRRAAGLSQEALAERARLSPGAISTLERSARRGPQHQTLSLIAEALELGPAERERLELAAAAGRLRSPLAPATATIQGSNTSASFPHNVPGALTSFHGRERDIADVTRLLDERRLVTLLGSGGVGKTRLALEVARERIEAGAYPDGVWFADLAPLDSAGLVTTSIARMLGVRERADESLVETIARAFAEKRALLVLDNCENVLDECARLTETLLQRVASLTVLVTTREALRAQGECIVRVEPLPAFDEGGPAIDLLVSRLIDADFTRYSTLTDDERAAVATIARRLDGVPLALELAAGRARDLTLAHIITGLDERFALLSSGRRTAPERQYTLRGMVDGSFASLDATQRRIFARLGLFAEAFTPEAAAAICADDPTVVREALAALIAKSLVTVVEDREGRLRYRLLETMRAYARDRLREDGDEDAYAARFARHYLAVAVAADARYGRIENVVFVASVRDDLEEFRVALAWAFGRGNAPQLGVALAGAMGWIYRQLALEREGVTWVERALAVASPGDPHAIGRLQMALSFFCFNIGSMKRALDAASAATAAYRGAEARAELAWSLTQEALCAYRYGRFDDVRIASDEAVSEARASGDVLRLAGALNASALAIPASDTQHRLDVLEEAIRCYRASGDADAIVPSAHLAAAYYEAGRFQRAYEIGIDVAEMARRGQDRSTLSSALINVAAYALTLDETAFAERASREALTLVRDLGKTLNAMCALQHLATVAVRTGDATRAARLAGAADALYRDFDLRREPTEQTLYDRTIDESREAIGEQRLNAELAAGAALPLDAAIAEALAPLGAERSASIARALFAVPPEGDMTIVEPPLIAPATKPRSF